MKKVLKIAKREAKELQQYLNMDKPIPDMGEAEIAETYTVKFEDSIEADIKVCNGDTGAYIDAVLFQDGCEVMTLEPSTILLGEYIWNYDGKEYTAILK